MLHNSDYVDIYERRRGGGVVCLTDYGAECYSVEEAQDYAEDIGRGIELNEQGEYEPGEVVTLHIVGRGRFEEFEEFQDYTAGGIDNE